MINEFIIRKFVKNHEEIKNRKVIKSYGYLCGAAGIISNAVLSLIKIIIGININSIAVIADAVNNISDIGSSVVAIIGFGVSDKPADEKHPFGHARAEYLSALIIAVMVLLVGFKFLTTSFDRIRNPEEIASNTVTLVILLLSISIKIWQANFYTSVGEKIKSSTLKAAAADSRSDVLTTGVVVFSIFSSGLVPNPIDGYVGLLVSVFIIYNGWKIVTDAIDPLIGTAPDKDLVEKVIERVESFEGIRGSHDLIIHSYGGGRNIATIHAEVSDRMNIVEAHEIIDRAEREISEELHIDLIIHMDPINYDDIEVKELYHGTKYIISEIDSELDIHDFRIVPEKNGAVIFDLVVPLTYTDRQIEETKKHIREKLTLNFNRSNIKITIDKSNINV